MEHTACYMAHWRTEAHKHTFDPKRIIIRFEVAQNALSAKHIIAKLYSQFYTVNRLKMVSVYYYTYIYSAYSMEARQCYNIITINI